ncbi:UDP-N-acetylmuramate--L-alanine ligase [Spirochaetota bacterium]
MSITFTNDVHGLNVYLVGIKGTGLCAFAEILLSMGASIRGSDVKERFYTDEVLEDLGISVLPFDKDNITKDIDLIIYSAAYKPDTHAELLMAKELSIPVMSYPEALGAFSENRNSGAIAGVHGKTSTTAIAGVLARAVRLPANILVGSRVPAFGNRSTLNMGNELFIAETCEYRRHFLHFKPRRIVLTSVEPDHQDYYPDYEAIATAFTEYLCSLPKGGTVIYCQDDKGAVDVWTRAKTVRADLKGLAYGFDARGDFRIASYKLLNEKAAFTLAGFGISFETGIPGRHIALDAAAAIALCSSFIAEREGRRFNDDELKAMAEALAAFSGSSRRSELLGEAKGVLFADDYGHHPSAIKTTLRGFKDFYPKRRLVIDFMSHTSSRTKALMDDFAAALSDPYFGKDSIMVLHKIYLSAREQADPETSGYLLFEKTRKLRPADSTFYFEEVMEAKPFLSSILRPEDLFISLGAGDNFRLGQALYNEMKNS